MPGRGSRVTTLIIAILLASLADLALTLEFLTSVGMAEANPVARAVIGTGSLAVVVGFKVGLSATACAIFWVARKRLSGEVGAWAGMLLMAWLMIRWNVYIDQSHMLTGALHGNQHASDSRWVVLGE
jgi:hypothetical protein